MQLNLPGQHLRPLLHVSPDIYNAVNTLIHSGVICNVYLSIHLCV